MDKFSGWRKISLPFSSFERSAPQTDGAANDRLTLTRVWGYGILPAASSAGTCHLDRIYLQSKIGPFRPVIFNN
ncbi:MAG: carbohydrate binding domain-containing protein [Candidatus Promineifilaceae bacterium]|nr:carbohydrate binding domain-containing protein [Candidatus Promineifilaceae bacterium]